LIVTITLNYEKVTAVKNIQEQVNVPVPVKVVKNGKFIIIKAGKEFNAAGQLVR
jgi:hypothetical protein